MTLLSTPPPPPSEKMHIYKHEGVRLDNPALVFGWQPRLEGGNSVALGCKGSRNVFHSGIVLLMIDLHNGEYWSLPNSLCIFLWCEVLVSHVGEFNFSSSGDISKCPFNSLSNTHRRWIRCWSAKLRQPRSFSKVVMEMMPRAPRS